MTVIVQRLTCENRAAFARVAPGVYGDPVRPDRVDEFLDDPRHHAFVAIDEGTIVGSVTAMHYVHPDKDAPELWINELAVAPDYRGQGIAKRLLRALLARARDLGCSEAWVLTDRSNHAAMRVYQEVGGIEAPHDQVMFTFHPNASEWNAPV